MGDDELASRWPAILADRPDIRDRLLTAYGAEHRGYHDRLHLSEVLDRIDELVAADSASIDRDAVVLAAWFHDAVYGEGDDEERSALLTERELADALSPALVAEVARLVRMTAEHRPVEGDANGAVLSDADLGILAADPDRYDDYVAGVRRDHATVPIVDFIRGRTAILRALLDKATLFHTDHARASWESQARANVERELARLETS